MGECRQRPGSANCHPAATVAHRPIPRHTAAVPQHQSHDVRRDAIRWIADDAVRIDAGCIVDASHGRDVTTAGDSADAVSNLATLHAIAERLRSDATIRPLDAVATPAGIVVRVLPLTDRAAVDNAIAAALRELTTSASTQPRTINIPVCFDPEFAPDLDEVAAHADLCRDACIDAICRTEHAVAFLGFAPGFAYMLGLPGRFRIPRLDTPRTRVPAGSVAVAERYTGIYPAELPGGWRLIGRTPVAMFDATRAQPARLRPNDRVRFHAIDRAAFDKQAAADRDVTNHDA